MTTTLLVHGRPLGADSQPLVILKALLKLSRDAGDSFMAADKRLAEKEARVQAAATKRAEKRG